MATGARSKARYARRIRLGGRAAQLIGPLAFSMLVLLGGILVSPPADVAQLCGDRGEILNRLEQGHCPPPASCAAACLVRRPPDPARRLSRALAWNPGPATGVDPVRRE
jgi:hypothetical protein